MIIQNRVASILHISPRFRVLCYQRQVLLWFRSARPIWAVMSEIVHFQNWKIVLFCDLQQDIFHLRHFLFRNLQAINVTNDDTSNLAKNPDLLKLIECGITSLRRYLICFNEKNRICEIRKIAGPSQFQHTT